MLNKALRIEIGAGFVDRRSTIPLPMNRKWCFVAIQQLTRNAVQGFSARIF